ncbi:MAG: ABC transporter substrate-binding protein [Thermodesulfovibrionales bacterium]|nr:ABC transporter substrate-binding protein [Thermodesulfovibrionales bacterium]
MQKRYFFPKSQRFPYGALARSLVLLGLILSLLFPAGCTREKKSDTTTVRFVTWKPNQPAVWDEIVELFEKEHPDITIEREVGPHSSTAFHDLLTQKLKNKSPDVDVFFMDVIWPPEFAAAGWAMPLNELFSAEEQEQFLHGPVIANIYKDKIYGVPLFIDSGMLFYRKDLLDRYGFNPPKTWDEMVKQAGTIVAGESKKGADIYGFSGQFKQYEGLVCNMLEYILSNNGHILNPDTGNPEIAGDPAVRAMQFVRDNIVGGIATGGVLTYEEPESIAPFIEGKVVFHRNWPYAWEVSNNPERSKIAGKVAITQLPHFSGGKSYATLGGWQLGISNYSRNKDAAWKFVQFLTSERIQKLLALNAGLAPTRKALYGDAEILGRYPQFSEMKDVFLTAYPRPRSPLYPAISNTLQRFFSKIITDPHSDIAREAKAASREIEKILALTR